MPKISVIVPVYNALPFLDDCLRSIANQTFSDFECICVDDGSTDDSAAHAEQWARNDSRFTVIRQENTKQAGARNNGLRHASGEMITFVDSDDYIHPQYLETLLTALAANDLDVVGCGIQETSSPYNPACPPALVKPARVFQSPFFAFLKRRDIPTSVCARLYKRHALGTLTFKENVFFEDVPWTVSIMSSIKRYGLIDTPLYFYVKNPTSTMRSAWTQEKTESYISVIRMVHDQIAQTRPNDLHAVQKYILNGRIRMVLNRIRKSPAQSRQSLKNHARPLIRQLLAEKKISYSGLKLKHRIALYTLLKGKD